MPVRPGEEFDRPVVHSLLIMIPTITGSKVSQRSTGTGRKRKRTWLFVHRATRSNNCKGTIHQARCSKTSNCPSDYQSWRGGSRATDSRPNLEDEEKDEKGILSWISKERFKLKKEQIHALGLSRVYILPARGCKAQLIQRSVA